MNLPKVLYHYHIKLAAYKEVEACNLSVKSGSGQWGMIYIISKKKSKGQKKEKMQLERNKFVSLHETEVAVCIFGGYTYLVHPPACVLPLFYKHYKLCIIVYLGADTETETLVDLIR